MAIRSDIVLRTAAAKRALRLYTQDVERAFKKQEAAAERTSQKMGGRLSRTFGKIGLAAKAGIAGAAVSALWALQRVLRSSAQEAVRFEEGMAKVSTLIDTSQVSVSKLRDGIREIGRAVPGAKLGDLTEALYQVISAGVDADKALKLVGVSARAGLGGQTSTKVAIDGITNALNGFGLSTEKASDVADAFFISVKKGKTTFGELASGIGSVAAEAEDAGVSLEDVLSAVAALTLTGVSTSEAFTQLRAVFTAAKRSGAEFKEVGVDIQEALGKRGLLTTLQEVVAGARESGVELVDLFGQVEGAKAALTLTGVAGDKFAETLADMETRSGATETAFLKMSRTTSGLKSLVASKLAVAFESFGARTLASVNGALRITLDLLGRTSTELAGSIKALRDEIQGLKDAEEATRVIDRLRDKEEKTTEESIELQSAIVLLSNAFPGYISAVDEAGEATDFFTDAIRRQITAAKQLNFGKQAKDLTEMIERLNAARRTRDISLAQAARIENVQLPEAVARSKVGSPVDRFRTRAEASIPRLEKSLRTYSERGAKAAAESAGLVRQIGAIIETAPDAAAVLDAVISSGLATDIESATTLVNELTASYMRLTEVRVNDDDDGKDEEEGEEEKVLALSLRIAAIRKRRDAIIEEGSATEELIRLNRELNALEEERNRLRGLGLVKPRENTGVKGLQRLTPRGQDPGIGFALQLNRASDEIKRFNREEARLRLTLDEEALDKALEDLKTETRQRLQSLRGQLADALVSGGVTEESVGKFLAFWDSIAEASGDVDDNAKSVRQHFTAIARSARALVQVGDVFGGMSDDVRQLADSVINLAESYIELSEARSKGLDLAAQLPGFIGIGASILSGLDALFDSGSDDVRDAVEENTRRIEKSIHELAMEMREAPEVSGDLSRAIQEAFAAARFESALLDGPAVLGDDRRDLGSLQDRYEALFDRLDDAGVDTQALRDQAQAFIDRMNGRGPEFRDDPFNPGQFIADWTKWLEDFRAGIISLDTDIQGFTDRFDSPGAFNTDIVSGIIGEARFLQALGGAEDQEVFDGMLQHLFAMEGLSEDMMSFLADIAAISDPTSAEGREALTALVNGIARDIADPNGEFDLGSLNSSQMDDLLNFFSGLFSGDAAGGTSQSASFSRSITEVQANLVSSLLQTGLYWQERTALAVEQMLDTSLYVPGDALNPAAGGITYGGPRPITFTGPVTIQASDPEEFMTQLDDMITARTNRLF